MAMDKFCAAEVAAVLSRTVMLKFEVKTLSGVPLMTPVVALSVKPCGRDPLLTIQFV